MPSEATSPPVRVTVLAALWVSVGRCGVLGCDSGKLSLDRDLPAGAVYWDCTASAWPQSAQRLPSIDTVFDPEPARQICMDKSISYDHDIPNSGAYRPIRAESGEYLYCPPQRWLNNLRHGASVLLYHPCALLREHRILSDLAHSCLPHYIITPHPQLKKHMPVALVSWGRTLELSTAASSDICDWLETTQNARNESDGMTHTRKYTLLLTRSAELHQEEQATKMKDSLRECCEHVIFSVLSGAAEAELEHSLRKKFSKQMKGGSKSRQMRAAVREKSDNVDINKKKSTMASVTSVRTNRILPQRTGDVHSDSTLGSSADYLLGNNKPSDLSSPSEAPQIQTQTQGLKPRPTTPLGSGMSETPLGTGSLGFGASQAQKGRPRPKQSDLKNLNQSAGTSVPADGVSKQNHTDRTEALALSYRDEGKLKQKEKDSDEHSLKVNDSKEKNFNKHHTADGNMKDNEIVDVKERELEHMQLHSDTHSHHKSESAGLDSMSKPQSESLPKRHPQAASHSQPVTRDCNSCAPSEQCDCNKAPGAEAQAAVVHKALPRTPRTDEAVWAAAALGFLLVLLTLSVLHTRLYRHWRTAPSLYWHDPQQDYDSVADVIRRRLRIAKRRRKRGRRQECVLLPSSSSSDEHP